MKPLLSPMILTALLAAAIPAHAADDRPAGTLVSLTAIAAEQVANDEVAVVYSLRAEGKEASPLRTEVNRMAQAIRQALAMQPELTQRTLDRQLSPVWDYSRGNGRRNGWELVQREEVVSRRLDEVAAWVEAIEAAGGGLESVQFRIATPTRLAAEQRLRMAALTQFRQRAGEMAAGLQAPSFRILSVQTDMNAPPPPMLMRERAMPMVAMADSAPAPKMEAGVSELQVVVSGSIELPPHDFPASR